MEPAPGECSRGEFCELLVAGESGSETEEGEEVGALSLVPDGEPAIAEQPGDGPLDLPAVPAEPLARLDHGPCDARDESALRQPGEVVGGEARLAGAEFDGEVATGAASGADRGYAAGQGLEGRARPGARGAGGATVGYGSAR